MDLLKKNKKDKENIINNIESSVFTFEDINCNITDHLEDKIYKDDEVFNNYLKQMQDLSTKVINNLDTKKETLEKELKKIEEDIKKLEDDAKKISCKNIKDLYNLMITDAKYHNQSQIFSKILNDSEYAKIYLSSYAENTDKKKKDVLGTITVLGTFNFKKNQREEYEIKVYKNSDKGTFWCNCPDHKFNSTKKGTVCKHITFIVCKVYKYLKLSFFDNKTLPDDDVDKLIEKLKSDSLWKDKAIAKKQKKITLESFKEFTKELEEEDLCPVCYDELYEADKAELLTCPQCCNYVHNECMEVWLERRDTCVYCKDDIWKNYKTLKNAIK